MYAYPVIQAVSQESAIMVMIRMNAQNAILIITICKKENAFYRWNVLQLQSKLSF